MNIVKAGFTLAEVLITLSIIGVVAALTIPSLIVKNQEKETVVQLKKAYNVFSNAFSLVKLEYGSPDNWGIATSSASSKDVTDKFAPYLNIIRRCDYPATGCFIQGTKHKFLNGSDDVIIDTQPASKFILADGTSAYITTYANCTSSAGTSSQLSRICGAIHVDLNSNKKPNQYGKDTFSFWMTPESIIPRGTPDETGNTSLEAGCLGNNGKGCAAWVILKENTDYPPAGIGWDN